MAVLLGTLSAFGAQEERPSPSEIQELRRRLEALEQGPPQNSEPVLDRLRRELGLDDLQVHGAVRPRFNLYHNLITLGRDTTAPDFAGRDDAALYFVDLRAWIELRLRSGAWGTGLRLDLAGNDFNDGGLLGNDTDVTNSNLGLGPAGLRDFDADLGQAWVSYEAAGWKAELGRLPYSLAHGILTRIQRDSLRVTRKEGPLSLTAAWIFGGQGGRSADVDEGLSGDDSAVKFTTGSIGEFNTFSLLALAEASPELRISASAARQADSTRDDRFTEKAFFDVAAFYSSGGFEFSVEGIYLGGRGARSAALGERPDFNAYSGFARLRFPWGETGLEPGFSAGIGSGDSTPSNDELTSIESLFVDETHFAYTYIYADDLHGYNGSSLSLRRAAGFANTWFLQPGLRWRIAEGLAATASWTFLRAVRGQPEGTGPLGPFLGAAPGRGNYGLDPLMRVDATGSGRSRDLGDEFDLGAELRAGRTVRLLANFGIFLPGDVFGAPAHSALKADLGVEFRF